MDENKRSQLEQRRAQLQTKMEAEAFVEQHIKPMLDVLDYLKLHGVPYRITGLVHIATMHYPYVADALSQAPYVDYGFGPLDPPVEHLEKALEEVFERFPSTNGLRYVPNLPKYADYGIQQTDGSVRHGLQIAIQALNLPDQPVYLYYLRYAIVLEVSLFALQNHDHDDLFNTWHGDAIIFVPEGYWLIAYTLEDEWLGGKRT